MDRRPTMSMAVNAAHFKELLIQHLESRNNVLEEMLEIAWEAITEAGYEGFSNKLKDFMENE